MLLASVKPTRQSMIRVLRRYSSVPLEALALMSDAEIHDLTTRLKYAMVVSDTHIETPRELMAG